MSSVYYLLDYFRVPLCLCFKAIESKCETILVKMTLICMKMKLHAELIFIYKVLALRLVLKQSQKRTRKWSLTLLTLQEDVMHRSLTVNEVLVYQAHLRLPSTISNEEKRRRIQEVNM